MKGDMREEIILWGACQDSGASSRGLPSCEPVRRWRRATEVSLALGIYTSARRACVGEARRFLKVGFVCQALFVFGYVSVRASMPYTTPDYLWRMARTPRRRTLACVPTVDRL
jgi:hypothetical protein